MNLKSGALKVIGLLTGWAIFICGFQIIALAQHRTGFKSVAGSNWDFKVLSVENTGKQRWKETQLQFGKVHYIVIKDDNLSFWRLKAKVTPEKQGYLKPEMIKLVYTTQDGKTESRLPAAHIADSMGNAAMSGSFTLTFGPDKPVKLDLLFLAPRNSDAVSSMHVRYLDNGEVRLIPE